MRGDWSRAFRNDYTEPKPLSENELQLIGRCKIEPREGFKTWFCVYADGELIGYVTTRIGSQSFRTVKDSEWKFAAHDWSQKDPKHGLAIIKLLRQI